MKMLNRRGERGQPCLTPVRMQNHSDWTPCPATRHPRYNRGPIIYYIYIHSTVVSCIQRQALSHDILICEPTYVSATHSH